MLVLSCLTANGINELSIDQQLSLDFASNVAVVNVLELRGCSCCYDSWSEGT